MTSDFNDVVHCDVWHTSRHGLRSSLLQIMAEFLHSSFSALAVVTTVRRVGLVIQLFSFRAYTDTCYSYRALAKSAGTQKVRQHLQCGKN